MSTRLTVPCVSLLAALLVGACNPQDTGPGSTGPEHTDEARTAAAAAVNRFGIDLYKAMDAAPDENLVISPVGVASALGLLLPGSVDQARDELLAGLHLPDLATANDGLSGLGAELAARDGEEVTLSLASRGFVQDGYSLHQEYVRTLESWYGAELATVDYAERPEAARREINTWVSDRTNALIPELMPDGSVTPLTRLVLANAVYLLADWETPFDPERTGDGSFHLPDGNEIHVPMMRDQRRVPVSVGDGYRAAELAYAGDSLSMLVIIPEDMAAYSAGLDAGRINGIAEALEPREASLWLPRLETRTRTSLVDSLRGLGIERVFEPDAGWLTGIADDRRLHVSAVQHETYLRVDEQGTEAAAGTGISVGVTSLGPEPVRIHADRPYLLVLRDRDTGAILFFGRIADPR